MPIRLLCILLVVAQLCGCATVVPKSADYIRSGDRVDLHMVDGRVEQFVVSESTHDAICSASACVPAADVDFVIRRDDLTIPKLLRVAALVALGVILYHGIYAAGAAAAYSGAFR